MFSRAGSFNQDISSWDVSDVEDMSGMFYAAFSFNHDISGWNVSDVEDMNLMFYQAYSFDQDLSNWDVSDVNLMSAIFLGVTLSTENYDALLNSWSQLSLKNDVSFHGGDSKYSDAAEDARNKLINDFNWTITDGGKE